MKLLTNVFISHSSRDNEIAIKLRSRLNDFQFVGKVWIDKVDLKPCMKLESFFDDIDKSDIIIVIVSEYSKDSIYVKKEIEYSLRFQEKKEKTLIPILYNIKPDQIPLDNLQRRELLNIYVSLDNDLFNIQNYTVLDS